MAIQQLVHTLGELVAAHQEMLKSGYAKKEAIMNNEVDTLIQIMNHESRIIKQIASLEDQRISDCHVFLQEKGIKSMLNLTITELSRLVFEPDEKASLLQVQAALSQTLQELKTLNDLNQQLIEQSLAFVNYSLDLIGAPSDEEPIYKPPTDKPTGSKGPGFFDARA